MCLNIMCTLIKCSSPTMGPTGWTALMQACWLICIKLHYSGMHTSWWEGKHASTENFWWKMITVQLCKFWYPNFEKISMFAAKQLLSTPKPVNQGKCKVCTFRKSPLVAGGSIGRQLVAGGEAGQGGPQGWPPFPPIWRVCRASLWTVNIGWKITCFEMW
jgi:hypothetical protein